VSEQNSTHVLSAFGAGNAIYLRACERILKKMCKIRFSRHFDERLISNESIVGGPENSKRRVQLACVMRPSIAVFARFLDFCPVPENGKMENEQFIYTV